MLPSRDDLISVLLELAVPHEDIPEILTLAESVDPGLLEPYVRELVGTMGSLDPQPRVEPRPDQHPLFFVLVFVAARPHVLEYHRAHGIPGDASRFILADVGRHLAVHRRRHPGIGGLEHPNWLTRHFRGLIYQLGRLQFERVRVWDVFGLPATDLALSVHIPEFCGPLTPAACDEAFARAVGFFARHFPGERYEWAICGSWLLDPQLRDHLPDGSNIVAFQRRFEIVRVEEHTSSRDFVLAGGRLAGREWKVGSGYFRLG